MEVPGLQERRIAAIVGALVADASAQPIHWNYNVEKLDALLSGSTDVGFREPSVNPFYLLPCGSPSTYGDQSFVILKSLVEHQGLDVRKLVHETYEWFGPNSVYEDTANNKYSEKSDIVENKSFPIHRPWRHFSIKDFLKNVQAGKEETGSETDSQVDCIVRVVSAVALYAGRPDMLDRAEAVIRVTQNSDTSVAVGLAAARLLEQYILHGPCEGALDHVIKELASPGRANPQDLDRALASFLREVAAKKDAPHIETARSIRID